jgi:hypothetical protein
MATNIELNNNKASADTSTQSAQSLQTPAERIRYYVNYRGLRASEVAARLGKSHGWVQAMRRSTTLETLRQFCTVYSEVNFEWLAYGRGEMLNILNTSAQYLDDTLGSTDKATLLQRQNIALQQALAQANKTITALNDNIARLTEVNASQSERFLSLLEKVHVH